MVLPRSCIAGHKVTTARPRLRYIAVTLGIVCLNHPNQARCCCLAATIKMLTQKTLVRTQKPFSSAKAAAPCRSKLSVRCSAASEGSARRDVLLAGGWIEGRS